jgi:hypothetical protein
MVSNKQTQTNITKYGASSFLCTTEGKQKTKETMISRYGVEHSSQSTISQNKKKDTFVLKYGVDNPRKSKEIIANIKINVHRNNLEKYGCHTTQLHIKNILPLLQNYKWVYEQYVILNKTTEQISNELCTSATTVLNYIHEHHIDIKYGSGYSYNSINWLNNISKQHNITIQHAKQGGEYNIPGTKFRADGFCEETNTIYEFYGDYWHGNPNKYESTQLNDICGITMGELYTNTISREKVIKSLGYNVVTIWELDYNKQKEVIS